jgi:4-hydroxybenzoate polyprenyltransferase
VTAGAQRLHADSDVSPGLAAAIFDLSRGKQALLSIAQPGLAAVLALGELPPPRVLVVGLVAAWAGFFAVFSLNDVLDRKADALSLTAGKELAPDHDVDTTFVRHPLAHGDLSLRISLVWVGSLTAIAAVGAAVLSWWSLVFFAVAIALEALYCALRAVTPYKTIVSGVMVGMGGLAGWAAVAPLGWNAVRVAVFLALWEIGGRNIVNDLSDVGGGGGAHAGRRRVAAHALARSSSGAGVWRLVAGLVVHRTAAESHQSAGGTLLQSRQLLPGVGLGQRPDGTRGGWVAMTGGRMTAPSRQRPAASARRHPRLDAIDVAALFDRNADWYDRVNTVMTLGLDAGWRRWAAREAVAGAVRVAANSAAATDGALPRLPHVLDACAGTGQVALELARRGADVTVVDFSECMLARARRRFAAADLPLVTVAADLMTPAGLAAAVACRRPASASGPARPAGWLWPPPRRDPGRGCGVLRRA